MSYRTSNGEGWGLTHDGTNLIVSDGSAHITFFRIPTVEEIDESPAALKKVHVLILVIGEFHAS